ncbi:MAG: hydantoinase B/oxoprolinase family protein, partial [Gaiellaceae bacterium]
GEPFASLVNEGCGWGGRPEKDGNNTLCQYVGNCACQPIEVLETRFPIIHESFSIAEGSAGAGRNRGGFGSKRQFRVECEELRVNGFIERVKIGPYPLFGGDEGGLAGLMIARAGGDFQTPQDAAGVACNGKFSDVVLGQGDRLVSYCSGGAGYGDPLERDLDRIAEDVLEGFVTPEQAAKDYGVAFASDGSIDAAATDRRREELRQSQAG